MTKQRKDNHSTEFGLWLRKQKDINSSKFDAQNLDYIWFAYRQGWIILIEEKRYNAKQSYAQKDTHNIIHQMLKFASDNKFNTTKGNRHIVYKGYFLVQFEKTNPDDSKWIKINGKIHTTNDLLFLLKYGHLINFKEAKANIKDADNLPPPLLIQAWGQYKANK